MKGIVCCVSVPGTNPLVLRRLRLGGEKTLRDLGFAASLSLGVEGETISFAMEDHTLLPDDTLLSLRAGESGVLKLACGEGNLQLLLDVEEVTDAAEDLPAVLTVIGLNLPQEIADAAEIRQIQRQVLSGGMVTRGQNIWTRSSLRFSEKRFRNSILKRYAPELAAPQINMSLGVPLQVMLNRHSMVQLREIARRTNTYYYSPIRKAELIKAVCRTVSRDFFARLFAEMLTCAEYESFRSLVTGGKAEPQNLNRLWVLNELSLVMEDQGGVCFAQELLEYYNGFFATEQENRLRLALRLESALNWCGSTYGVFRYEHFLPVARVRAGEQVTEAEMADFWQKSLERCRVQGKEARFQNGSRDSLSDKRILSLKDAEALLPVLDRLPEHYVPTAAEMDFMDIVGPALPGRLDNRLFRYLNENHYAFARDIGDVKRMLIRQLQVGVHPTNAMDQLPRNTMSYFYSRSDEIRQTVTEILEEAWEDVPMVRLGGYTIRSYREEGYGDPLPLLPAPKPVKNRGW